MYFCIRIQIQCLPPLKYDNGFMKTLFYFIYLLYSGFTLSFGTLSTLIGLSYFLVNIGTEICFYYYCFTSIQQIWL